MSMLIGKIAVIIIPNKDDNFHKITKKSLLNAIITDDNIHNYIEVFTLDSKTKNNFKCNNFTNDILNCLELITKIKNQFYSTVIIKNHIFFDTNKIVDVLSYIDHITTELNEEKNNKLFATFGEYDDFIIVNNDKLISYNILNLFNNVNNINNINILDLCKDDIMDMFSYYNNILYYPNLILKWENEFKVSSIIKYINDDNCFFILKFSKKYFNQNKMDNQHKLMFLNNAILYKLSLLNKKYNFKEYEQYLNNKLKNFYYIQMILNYSKFLNKK